MQLISNGVIILFKKINIFLYFTIIIIIIQNNNLNTFFKTSTTLFIHYILVSFMISLSFDSHTLSFHVKVCLHLNFSLVSKGTFCYSSQEMIMHQI